MPNQDLINYINQAKAEGASDQKIKEDLLKVGWMQTDIDEAFADKLDATAAQITSSSNPATPQKISIAKIAVIAISAVLFISGTAGAFYYADKQFNWGIITSKKVEEKIGTSIKIENQLSSDIEALKINYVAVPEADNSANIFNALGANPISSTDDKNFLNKYLGNAYLPENPPPLTESQKIISNNSTILTVFEAGTNKKYYQCSDVMGDQCYFAVMRNIARLAVLNSFVLLKTGQVNEAQQYAFKVVKLGQMITAQADDMLNLIVGWSIQKLGYTMEVAIKNRTTLSQSDKISLIGNLREEHKKVLRFMYTRNIEMIDYITDKNKKLSGIIDQETEQIFASARAAVNNVTWKPNITKQWFYDSYKIELSNVDLACGSELKKSQIDIGFDPSDKTQTENFIGKTLYSVYYAGTNGADMKRCDIENIINAD